jgi:hypothetical protein
MHHHQFRVIQSFCAVDVERGLDISFRDFTNKKK